MRLLILLLLLISTHPSGAQIISKENKNDPGLPFCDIGEEAIVNQQQWNSFLLEKLVLNDTALDKIPLGRYTVLVQFAIDTNGKIEEVVLVEDPGHGLGLWVKKTLKACDKKIARPLSEESICMRRTYRRQPITFVIEREEICEEDALPLILL